MTDSSAKAARWLAKQGDSWSPDINKLQDYAQSRKEGVHKLGKHYGDLSSMAHPTRDAAENSASLVTKRHGVNTEVNAIERATLAFESELPELLYRLFWLLLDGDAVFIPLYIDEAQVPTAIEFADQYAPAEDNGRMQ